MRRGYGKNAEFGKVTFRLTKTEAIDEMMKDSGEVIHDVVLTLVSDLIMYNETGTPSASMSCLREYLAEALIKDLTIEKTFLGSDTVGGYNTTWGRMKPLLPSIAKGSVFVLHSQKGFQKKKLEELQNCFLGERVSEGYGEVRFDEVPERAEYTVYDSAYVEAPSKTQLKTDLLQQLEEREKKHRLEQRIREIAADVKLKSDIFGNAVSRVRLIFKNRNDYQDLCNQVEAISSEKTREACKEIIEQIKPDKLADEYSVFQNDNQKAYEFIYHVYLAELKYHARIQRESGNGGEGQ